MDTKETTMSTKYDPQTIEKGRYEWWWKANFSRQKMNGKTTVHDCDPAAKCDGEASIWGMPGTRPCRILLHG